MSYGKMNASYCIGFKSDFFDALKGKLSTTPTSGLSYAFEKVSYEGHQHVNSIIAIENIILRIDAAISGNDVDNDELMDDFASKLVDEMIEKIMFAACAIKPKEFTDESESRLIFLTNEAKIAPQNIQICERSGILIPFIDFEFDYEWIEEIIIGPNIQTDLAQKGLESLLKSKGINCKVTPTTCTLRQF
ncbi:hypothetical protein [Cellvibrio sp.]|uniref:hypothetical protein n=1 Tax=Cellvibrio sp. TaxID=1965322 RepID=UPI003F4BAF51